MTYDLTNKQGKGCNFSNRGWMFILEQARAAGWEPMGTVLYKRSEFYSDLETVQYYEPVDNSVSPNGPLPTEREDGEVINITVLHGEGDAALAFDQTIKSGEIDPEWDGVYIFNDGQIITAQDAMNMAAALRRFIESIKQDPEWMAGSWPEQIHELIILLESGEVMIT